jgi:hypothetical protein
MYIFGLQFNKINQEASQSGNHGKFQIQNQKMILVSGIIKNMLSSQPSLFWGRYL